MEEKRKCLECGEILRGRVDKKFCSDHCRNAYNNRKFSDVNNLVRQINRVLKKNRGILAQLNTAEKTMSSRNELLKKGFNFNYFTNTYITRSGKVYHFCYDQGYAELEKGKIVLVKKQEYVG